MRLPRSGLLAVLLVMAACHQEAKSSSAGVPPPPEDSQPPENPQPPMLVIPVEVPSEFPPELAAQMLPIAPSPFYSTQDAPVFGTTYFQTWPLTAQPATASAALATGNIGRAQQAAVAVDMPTMGLFTFQVTSLSYVGQPDQVDFAAHFGDIKIDGQLVGSLGSGEVQLPRTQTTAKVTADVWATYKLYHASSGGIGSVQNVSRVIDTYSLTVSSLGDRDGCAAGSNGSICWRARGLGSPPLCFGWQAQFLDGGPWTDFASESFAVSREVQSFPAAYARVDVTITRSGSVESYHLNDALDERGCIPAEKLPVLEQWQGDIGLLVLKVTSLFCYDSSGGACALSSGSTVASGVNVEVRSGASATGPQTYCWAVTDDPTKAPAECERRSLAGADLTHLYFVAARSSVAQVASVIGHILSREHETGGGLGVEEALARRRLSSPGGYPIILTDTPCGDTTTASCTDSTHLYLAPAPNALIGSATDRKFLIAHEFGHFVQFNGQGMPVDFIYNAPEVSTNLLCKCDHVLKDQRSHCLQSAEEPQIAQTEGFAQFFSALVWNRRVDEGGTGCTFVYYKPILDDHDLPGHIGASSIWNGHVLTPSATAVSCSEPARWRDQHCLADNPGKAVLYGTEWDWMGFYWALLNDVDPARRWSVVDIFDAYRAAGRNPVAWEPTSMNGVIYVGLLNGAQTLKGSGPALDSFRAAGDTYGVSRK